MDKLTLSVAEAATLLGICKAQAYRLASRGELPGLMRLGRTLRVSRPALMKHLEAAGGNSAAA